MKFLCTCIVGPTKKEYTMRDNRIIPHYKTSLPSFHSGLQTTLRVRPVRAPIAAKARAAAHTTPIAERGVLHTSHTMASYPEKDSCCFATEWLQGDGLRTHTHTRGHAHTDDTPFTMVSCAPVSLRTYVDKLPTTSSAELNSRRMLNRSAGRRRSLVVCTHPHKRVGHAQRLQRLNCVNFSPLLWI